MVEITTIGDMTGCQNQIKSIIFKTLNSGTVTAIPLAEVVFNDKQQGLTNPHPVLDQLFI
ncbi:hypothetical protein LF95_02095 [Thalassospira sp. TSL5-1]|nr:hypothetical protein LF95_02095 [Thalassospira sp. TSL5-1]